jgi:glycosyltransferase involved in cell wall biosynthesis
MNLLLVNYEYPPVGGGAANATQFLGQAFARLGHRVHVLTSGLQKADGLTNEAGIQVHRLPIGRRQPDRARQWEMIKFLLQSRAAAPRLHRTYGFDAAIAFFTIPSGPAALRLFHLAQVPYLVSLRGGDVPGHVPGLAAMHGLTRPLRRAVLRHAAAVVANSEGLAETSRAADPFPTKVIASGVDTEAFHPAGDRNQVESADRVRLLFVGRVHPEKNLGSVMRQLAALPLAMRKRFELHVVGDGAQRSELTALAETVGLTAQVRWLGWQNKPALPQLYRQADALVNPSQYEGMPNVVLEAMASGLPVFASDVPGNRSVIVPDKTGVLFPLGRPEELRAALVRLANDPAWGRMLGRAGRSRAVTDFSWTHAAQCYLDLLIQSVHHRSNGRSDGQRIIARTS